MRFFDCLCYAFKLPKGDKFASRARRSVFIGYSKFQKSYRLYDLVEKDFFLCRDVVFREHTLPYQTGNLSPELDMFELNSTEVSTVYSTGSVVPVVLDTAVDESSECGIEPLETDTMVDAVTKISENNISLNEENLVPLADTRTTEIS